MQTSKNLWWAAASLVAMVVGAFGPWMTVLGVITINGTDGRRDGWVVLGAAAAAGAVLLLRRRRRWPDIVSLLAGGLAAATVGYDISNVDAILGGNMAELRWGIYLALVGSISLIVASTALLLQRRRSEQAHIVSGTEMMPPA